MKKLPIITIVMLREQMMEFVCRFSVILGIYDIDFYIQVRYRSVCQRREMFAPYSTCKASTQ